MPRAHPHPETEPAQARLPKGSVRCWKGGGPVQVRDRRRARHQRLEGREAFEPENHTNKRTFQSCNFVNNKGTVTFTAV